MSKLYLSVSLVRAIPSFLPTAESWYVKAVGKYDISGMENARAIKCQKLDQEKLVESLMLKSLLFNLA